MSSEVALKKLEDFTETLKSIRDMTEEERSTFRKLNKELDAELEKERD